MHGAGVGKLCLNITGLRTEALDYVLCVVYDCDVGAAWTFDGDDVIKLRIVCMYTRGYL